MTDAESKFLTKNYKAFLYDYLHEIKSGNDPIHIHPPPAFQDVYQIIIEQFVDMETEMVTSRDLISMMDMVAKFVSYLDSREINYHDFSGCACTTLTTADVELLLQSGGENR